MAIAVPRDSPYKIRFFSFTPFDFNQSNALFASSYKPSSLGLPSLLLNPLYETIKKFKSNFDNSFNL